MQMQMQYAGTGVSLLARALAAHRAFLLVFLQAPLFSLLSSFPVVLTCGACLTICLLVSGLLGY
jgi:hypothetical protein